MSHYKLNISFPDDALNTIYAAKQKLALVKSVEGDSGAPVIWIATAPFESNVVEWNNEFQLYSSRQEAKNGATIRKLSETKAIENHTFDFKDAVFQSSQTDDKIGANKYGVHNSMNEYPSLTFGLAASVSVNGKKEGGKPINAILLPYNHTAVMSPVEKVSVFLASDIDDGVVQTKGYSNMIQLIYSGNQVEKSIRYDTSKGMFVPE